MEARYQRFTWLLCVYGEDAFNAFCSEKSAQRAFGAVEDALTAQDLAEGIYYPEGSKEARWQNFKHEKLEKIDAKRKKESEIAANTRKRKAEEWLVKKARMAEQKKMVREKNRAKREKYAESRGKSRTSKNT